MIYLHTTDRQTVIYYSTNHAQEPCFGKNKKNIIGYSSAELAKSMVKIENKQ